MRLSLDWLYYLPEEPADYREWKPWFAWHPQIVEKKIVWLEWIERKPIGLYPPSMAFPCAYRLPIDPRANLED